MISVRNLAKHFGGIHAIDGVSLEIRKGTITGLIGPNGAGKTTLVNLITGVHRADAGRVLYQGEEVTRQQPFEAARRGLCRTFQIVQPFPEMTVLDNVASGAMFGAVPLSLSEARDAAREHIEFVGLAPVADVLASALPLANRKRLELAKSLAMKPKVLMLDEVNAGLNSGEINAALDLIREVARRGITILIIEHLMKVVLTVSQRLIVLHHGALIAEGKPDDVVNDPGVVEAYLGEKYARRLREASNV